MSVVGSCGQPLFHRQALSGPAVQGAIRRDIGHLFAAGADHPCETNAAVYRQKHRGNRSGMRHRRAELLQPCVQKAGRRQP